MPKDYQEEEDPIFTHLQRLLEVAEGKRSIESWNEIATDLINAYWDNGNAREREGVEKVEKEVPARNEAKSDSIEFANGYNTARILILDHIATIKSELK
jgi:hypothetical protein